MMPEIIVTLCVITGVAVYLFVSFHRCWQKERKILKEGNEKLRNSNRELEAQVKFMKEVVHRYEKGDCIEGDHCQSCKHSNTVTTESESMYGKYTQTVVTCLLTVPCAKFERND